MRLLSVMYSSLKWNSLPNTKKKKKKKKKTSNALVEHAHDEGPYHVGACAAEGVDNNMSGSDIGSSCLVSPSNAPVSWRDADCHSNCSICFDKLRQSHESQVIIRLPCCDQWIHIKCFREFASSCTRHVLLCPLCRSPQEELRRRILTMHIPTTEEDGNVWIAL